MTAALQRVQQQLKKNGHAGQGVEADLAAVQSLLLSPAFRSALTIHSKVQEVWCCGQPTLPAHHNIQQLVTEVCRFIALQYRPVTHINVKVVSEQKKKKKSTNQMGRAEKKLSNAFVVQVL